MYTRCTYNFRPRGASRFHKIERRVLRYVQQARVFEFAFDLVVAPRLRIVEVVRDVFVEFLVLVVGDVGPRAGPQRLRRVDGLPLIARPSAFFFAFLSSASNVCFHHLDGDADVIGILAHDVAQPKRVGELFRIVFQMQRDVGAARGFFGGRHREVRLTARTPPRRGVCRLIGAPRQYVDLSATMNEL